MNNIKNLLEKCSSLGDAYHKKHDELTEIFNNYKKLSGKTKEENEKVRKINELINKTKDKIMSKDEFNKLKDEQRDIMFEFQKLENKRLVKSYKKNKELEKQIRSKLYKENENTHKNLNIIDNKITKLANENYKYIENVEVIPNTNVESDKQTIIDFKPIIKVSPIQYLDSRKNKCVDKRKVTLIKKNKKVIKQIKKISKKRKHKSLPKLNTRKTKSINKKVLKKELKKNKE